LDNLPLREYVLKLIKTRIISLATPFSVTHHKLGKPSKETLTKRPFPLLKSNKEVLYDDDKHLAVVGVHCTGQNLFHL
jgi:hypothetical protein